jgi:hypothetical protein
MSATGTDLEPVQSCYTSDHIYVILPFHPHRGSYSYQSRTRVLYSFLIFSFGSYFNILVFLKILSDRTLSICSLEYFLFQLRWNIRYISTGGNCGTQNLSRDSKVTSLLMGCYSLASNQLVEHRTDFKVYNIE